MREKSQDYYLINLEKSNLKKGEQHFYYITKRRKLKDSEVKEYNEKSKQLNSHLKYFPVEEIEKKLLAIRDIFAKALKAEAEDESWMEEWKEEKPKAKKKPKKKKKRLTKKK